MGHHTNSSFSSAHFLPFFSRAPINHPLPSFLPRSICWTPGHLSPILSFRDDCANPEMWKSREGCRRSFESQLEMLICWGPWEDKQIRKGVELWIKQSKKELFKQTAWIPWKLVIPSRFISWKTHFLILAGRGFYQMWLGRNRPNHIW